MHILTQKNVKDLSKLLSENIGRPYEDLKDDIVEVLRPKNTEVDKLVSQYTDKFAERIRYNIDTNDIDKYLREILTVYSNLIYNKIYYSAYNDHCDISVSKIGSIFEEVGMKDYE